MIRAFQKSDLEMVSSIWLHTNLQAHNFIPAQYWRDNFDGVKEMFVQADVYVYESKNKIEGFIGMMGDYIAGIFVSAESQSMGIGGQLLGFAQSIRRQLRLHVYQRNGRAIKFYQRAGFSIQGESIDAATGEKEYCMLWRS